MEQNENRRLRPYRRVIAKSSLPTKIPLWQTIALYLLMEQQGATDLVSGIAYTVMALWWFNAIYDAYHEISRDVPGFGDRV